MNFLGANTFFFLGMLIVVFANRSIASEQNGQYCRQGIFKTSKEPLHVNVTKKFFVDSVLECAHQCRGEDTCEAFRHRNIATGDEINCQVTQGVPEHLQLIIDENTNEKWTVYTLQTVESPLCVKNNLCHSGGRCLADGCQADGFICDCDDKHYGKYCQNEIYYDYDIFFPNTSADNCVNIAARKVDFNEFTFSAWFKFNPGFEEYPLLSYLAENATQMIALAFKASDQSGQTIWSFSGDLFGHHVGTATVAINDGYWHHVGFSWSGISGEWMLLLDGVLWASRSAIFKGRTIPSGGLLTIGKIMKSGVRHHLVGKISRVNLWSIAINGSEIEKIAKRPGSRDGDLISWFLVKDFISGDLTVVRPSTAAFSGDGTNYDINLPMLLAQAKYPGPSKAMEKLSACLWFKGSDKTQFFSYNLNTMFVFGYNSGSMSTTINNVYTKRDVVGVSSSWHFLCVNWNGAAGTVAYYYDGYREGSSITKASLKTELPPGKNFILGLNSEAGTLTQLNIWDYEIAVSSIIAMSSGGFNVHGNMLSWNSLAQYVAGEYKTNNSDVFLPGFAVLAKRTKWCNDKYDKASCAGQLLARFGGHVQRESILWRCYCPSSLMGGRYTYDFSTASPSYHSSHSQLTAIK